MTVFCNTVITVACTECSVPPLSHIRRCVTESLCEGAIWSGIKKDDFDCGSMAHPPSLTPSFPIPDAWLTLDTSYRSLFLQARETRNSGNSPFGFSFVQYVNLGFYSNERFFDRFC
jgi:hypothetical protein